MAQKRGVVGVLDCFGYILLGKKADGDESLSGRWHLPGETLHDGEDDAEGLRRGFKEESNLEVVVERFLATNTTPTGTLLNWYLCKPKDYKPVGELDAKAGSDLTELRWVPRYEVPLVCDREAIERWPEEIREFFRYW